MDTSLLADLERWYASQCNEDWEHTYGVQIETLDNPGWLVRIDLWETELAERGIFEKRWRKNERDWGFIKITDRHYEASCAQLKDALRYFIIFSRDLRIPADE